MSVAGKGYFFSSGWSVGLHRPVNIITRAITIALGYSSPADLDDKTLLAKEK